MKDRADWTQCPAVFYQVNQRLDPLEVDLFVSRLTYQLCKHASWRPDPMAMATDAFTLDWAEFRGFANPPWNLIGRMLAQTRLQQAEQYYQDCHVSERATKLLLASWGQKSSKACDSLFGKWVSWCRERDGDPISCPIGEVINFFAHLYEQGYQYRSYNSYHSAISSMHEKVDGYEAGQHPMVSRLVKGMTTSAEVLSDVGHVKSPPPPL